MKIKSFISNKSFITPYLFILPNVVAFGVFFIVPVCLSLGFSFTNYDGLFKMDFVGFKNYAKILANSEFWVVLLGTFKYVFILVPLIYISSLMLALLATRPLFMLGLIRGMFYWPVMISSVVVGVIWKWIFGDAMGIANFMLQNLGFASVPWLTNDTTAFITIIIATVWSRAGFFMVIFIGGLNAIPETIYEAARLDGAKPIRQFFSITLPSLKPSSVLVLLLSCIEAFKAYPLVLALTGGGPGKATHYLVQYIYKTGFVKSQIGYAAAMSMVLFLIIFIFSSIQFKITKGGGNE